MVMGYRRHALKEGPMRLGLLGALLLAGRNPLDPTGDVFTLYRNSGWKRRACRQLRRRQQG